MSKFKKFIGTGSLLTVLITVLLAALITIINQPTPALSQTVQVASGSTPVGNTAWQPYGASEADIFLDVDTSSAGFKTTPIYITSLGGMSGHWRTTGATSIYVPTPTGFRVYVRFSNENFLTPAYANQLGWHINWIAVPQ
jgi:hypothetical protein